MEAKDFFNGTGGSFFAGMSGGVVIILALWSLIWKGLALWRAARRGDQVWYILLLILNTLGILEIVYYFLIAKTDKVAKK